MLPSSRIIEAARAVALAGEGVGRNRNLRVGAVLFKKGRVYEAKANTYKTHPSLSRYSSYPHLHAESNVLISFGLDNCDGLNLCVVRTLRNGELSMAKPCEVCQRFILDSPVKNVFFTNWEGKVEKLHG